jgi:hypothetical protein
MLPAELWDKFGHEPRFIDLTESKFKRRARLPALTDKIGGAVMAKAFEFATWSAVIEQERADKARLDQLKAKIASGEIKILTDE